MASIKVKFSVGQKVQVIKSGKAGEVVAVVVDRKGVSADVQVGTSKRPWRYAEADLQTQVEAEKAAKAKLKAAKTVKARIVKPAPAPVATPAPKSKAASKAKVVKKSK